MPNKLFRPDIPSACAYCSKGRTCPGTDLILCRFLGVMEPDGFCKRFEYDPLKRVPRRAPPLTSHDPDEFKL